MNIMESTLRLGEKNMMDITQEFRNFAERGYKIYSMFYFVENEDGQIILNPKARNVAILCTNAKPVDIQEGNVTVNYRFSKPVMTALASWFAANRNVPAPIFADTYDIVESDAKTLIIRPYAEELIDKLELPDAVMRHCINDDVTEIYAFVTVNRKTGERICDFLPTETEEFSRPKPSIRQVECQDIEYKGIVYPSFFTNAEVDWYRFDDTTAKVYAHFSQDVIESAFPELHKEYPNAFACRNVYKNVDCLILKKSRDPFENHYDYQPDVVLPFIDVEYEKVDPISGRLVPKKITRKLGKYEDGKFHIIINV